MAVIFDLSDLCKSFSPAVLRCHRTTAVWQSFGKFWQGCSMLWFMNAYAFRDHMIRKSDFKHLHHNVNISCHLSLLELPFSLRVLVGKSYSSQLLAYSLLPPSYRDHCAPTVLPIPTIYRSLSSSILSMRDKSLWHHCRAFFVTSL